uniref:GIY-YIG domain-containing protein n=1 Tax=viral metagenome TaxID=1070528 RepID=A0A6C0KJF8_9ZZZZ
MAYGYIYKISFPNGKCYIGLTTRTIKERWDEHNYNAKAGDTKCLYKSLRKYNMVDTFQMIVIDTAETEKELCEKEIAHIEIHNSHYKRGYGYNMTDGGEGVIGYRHTEETKRIMSEKSTVYYSDTSIRIAKSIEVKKYFENQENRLRLIKQLKSYYINHPEAKKKMSIRMTEYFSNLENRLNQSIRRKEFYKNNPEARQLVSIQMKEFMNRPDVKEANSKRRKEFYKNNPEAAKEHSERMKEIHKNNPEISKEHSEFMKEFMNRPDVKEANSKRRKEFYKNNPEAAKEHSEFMKEFMNRPDVKEANSKRMKEFMNRPDVKEAHSKRMKERGQTFEGKIRGPPKPFDVFEKNGTYIKSFNYQFEAREYLQTNYEIKIHIKIGEVLRGTRKSSAGFTFKYKE